MTSLHIDTQRDWRGGQNQILLLLRGLRGRGHKAELMALADTVLEHRAREEEFRVHTIPAGFVRGGAALQMQKLLRGDEFDIVHAHDPHGLSAAWLARAHRRATLVAHRRIGNPLSPGRVALARYRAARRILAISDFVKQRMIASGIPPAQIDVVYDGVEIPSGTTPDLRRAARQQWKIGEHEILLGCVGRLVPNKGQEILLQALPAVLIDFPDCRLILAGDGKCRPALEKLSRELGIAERVIFAGAVENIAQIYRAIDIFLFPAIGEGLGSSLLEAMSFGLPAVAAESGGVPEIIDDGCDGLLAPASSPKVLAETVLRVLKNPALAAQLGTAARKKIAPQFTADRMVESTLAAYKKALEVLPQ